jgi:hypothetical protein
VTNHKAADGVSGAINVRAAISQGLGLRPLGILGDTQRREQLGRPRQVVSFWLHSFLGKPQAGQRSGFCLSYFCFCCSHHVRRAEFSHSSDCAKAVSRSTARWNGSDLSTPTPNFDTSYIGLISVGSGGLPSRLIVLFGLGPQFIGDE